MLSIVNLLLLICNLSLGIILTSAGFGGGDLSICLSPKYGHVHGGGNGNDALSVAVLSVVVVVERLSSDDNSTDLVSWKLLPRLRHLGDGLSSLVSPS